MPSRFINISGNIAAGATTLAKQLCARLNWTPLLERPLDENPFISRFYRDPRRWAFQNQVFFILQSMTENQLVQEQGTDVCTDHTIYEHVDVYNRTLREKGALDHEEYIVLEKFFKSFENRIRVPDLLIYVCADIPILLERIRRRGRTFERRIGSQYLELLQKNFDLMVRNWKRSKILTLDSGRIDFSDDEVVSRIAMEVARTLPQNRA